jgi:hypothetical protein
MGFFAEKPKEEKKTQILRMKVVDKVILYSTPSSGPRYVTLFVDENGKPLEQYSPLHRHAITVYANVEIGSWYNLEIGETTPISRNKFGEIVGINDFKFADATDCWNDCWN